MSPPTTAAVIVAFVTLASACGHGSPTRQQLSQPPPSSAVSPSVTTTSIGGVAPTSTSQLNSPSTGPPTPDAGNSPECSTKSIAASWPNNRDGASGVLYYSVDIRNVAASTCHMSGYFGVSAFSPAGILIAANDSREADLGILGPVVLGPGASAQFQVGFQDSNLQAGGTDCHTVVGSLHLIPPDQTTSVQLATPDALSDSGHPPLCEQKLFVGPVSPSQE